MFSDTGLVGVNVSNVFCQVQHFYRQPVLSFLFQQQTNVQGCMVQPQCHADKVSSHFDSKYEVHKPCALAGN